MNEPTGRCANGCGVIHDRCCMTKYQTAKPLIPIPQEFPACQHGCICDLHEVITYDNEPTVNLPTRQEKS